MNRKEINSVTEMESGDHFCILYDDIDHFSDIISPYIISGLEKNEKVIYINDSHSSQYIINHLLKSYPPIYDVVNKGQFVLLNAQDTYIKDGNFDPDRMIELLKGEMQNAIVEHYTGLRVTGEMSWVQRGFPGTERLIEYESKVNAFFDDENNKCIGLCQYNINKFDYAMLLDIITAHPYVIYNDEILHNFYYIPTKEFLTRDLKEIEFWDRLENLKKLKHKNTELNESRKLISKALEIKSNFITNMSHEIRTPLNGISGMISLLQNTKLDDTQENYLSMLRYSSDVLIGIVEEILDYSRLDSGDWDLSNESFNLHTLIHETSTNFVNQANQKGLNFIYNIHEKVPESIHADSIIINKVLRHIIGNSIKFTDEGIITLEVTSLVDTMGKTILKFVVTDSGIGINTDDYSFIFDKFTQVETIFNKKYAGIGLGLTIVKALLDKAGGEVIIQNDKGNGTRFTVTIPCSIGGKDKSCNGSNNINVLIAEDNYVNMLYLQKFLEKNNFCVDCTKNGNEALRNLESNQYDIVLMDLQMPEMDGYECVEKIRQFDDEKCNIPIIAITGYAVDVDKEKIFKSGMDDVIAKPINEPALLNKISLLVDKYRAAV